MSSRARTAVIAIVTAGLLVVGAAPAFAPYARAAANAINVTEHCPKYLSLAVGRQDPMATGPQNVTILAFALPPSGQGPGTLVLERDVRVRPMKPQPLVPGETEDFHLHGRAVLPWDTGRLAPGTKILVGTPDTFGEGAQAPPQEFTITSGCDTPRPRLSSSCSSTAGQPHTWRVRNPEQDTVDFNAEVVGTRPAELHIGTVPANGVSDPFLTQVPGPDIVVLFVGGIPVDLGICLR